MVEPNVDPTHGPDKASEDLPGDATGQRSPTHEGDVHAPDPAKQPTAPEATGASGPSETDGTTAPADAPTDAASAVDTETEFARIVAGLDDVRSATDGAGLSQGSWLSDVPALPGVRPLGPRDHRATDEEVALEDEQGHFIPPDPGPVLGGDPVLTIAWFAVLAGILALLLSALLVKVMPSFVAWGGAGLLAVGAGILLWRLPHERGDSDGSDEPWV
ncbi:hypothetical protein ACTVCO_09935 [Sanguibacter sp. A247]|uniref:hypothetical protein n=1 Tax=unclassified Sanguibacter TaxID=2645534 RepID=UPI003FD7440E